MLQDLATLAPSVIICVAFLIGVGALLRREMAPKRRSARRSARQPPGAEAARERGKASET